MPVSKPQGFEPISHPVRDYWQLQARFRCEDQQPAPPEVSAAALATVLTELRRAKNNTVGFSPWKRRFRSIFD